jgi:hypothetical protein
MVIFSYAGRLGPRSRVFGEFAADATRVEFVKNSSDFSAVSAGQNGVALPVATTLKRETPAGSER